MKFTNLRTQLLRYCITHVAADEIPEARFTLAAVPLRHVVLALALARDLAAHGGPVQLRQGAVVVAATGLAVALLIGEGVTVET